MAWTLETVRIWLVVFGCAAGGWAIGFAWDTGEAVRVSGLGIFNVAARPARQGRNPQTGETIEIAASKAVRFHAGKAVKDALNPPTAKGAHRKKSGRRARANIPR